MGLGDLGSQQILEFSAFQRTLNLRMNMRPNRIQLESFRQFIYQLIAGNVRQNTFTQWELDLLFDLENLRVRKARRVQMLRRYIKAASRQISGGASEPPRLAEFLEREMTPLIPAQGNYPSADQNQISTIN